MSDVEYADHVRRDRRKARKPHHCSECPTEIQPGNPYWSCAYLFEGTWHSYKLCSDCYQLERFISQRFPSEDDLPIGGGWLHSEAIQLIDGYFDDEFDRFVSNNDAFWVEQGGSVRLTPWAKISLEVWQSRQAILAKQFDEDGQKQYLDFLVDKAIVKVRAASD